MLLKPQDIVVLLKLLALEDTPWTYNQLALDLGMSPSEVHAAIKRTIAAGLMHSDGGVPQLTHQAFEEFLLHGIKYVFIPKQGGLTRGFPTGYAASPLNQIIAQPDEPPPVWPHAEGPVRGYEFSPLYKSVPQAVQHDPKLYELLALVDALRSGRARERALAAKALSARLKPSRKKK